MATINLKNLQDTTAPFFEKWKISTSKAESWVSRKNVHNAVEDIISRDDLNGQGIYCFVRLAEPDGVGRIKYIGITSRGSHTLKKRMHDHLAKQCSSLRPELFAMNSEDAKRSILELGKYLHTPAMCEKYAPTQLKGRRMSQCDTIFLYPTFRQSPKIIEDAEAALILAAGPRPGEIHELINSKKTKGRRQISSEAIQLARQAILAWHVEGIGTLTSEHWLARLN